MYYYRFWCHYCYQGSTLILRCNRCRMVEYMVLSFPPPMQKTNPGRIRASGEGAEIVCCRWKSRAGHRGSESLQVTSFSENCCFPLFQLLKKIHFNFSPSPLFSLVQAKDSRYGRRIAKNREILQKPGKLLACWLLCHLLLHHSSALQWVIGNTVVGQSKLKCFFASQIAAHEKKAHDNWVRKFFLFWQKQFVFDFRLVQLMQSAKFSLIAYCPLCRESPGWRKKRSS